MLDSEIVFVCGANGTGKTTIARKYQEQTGFSYIGADEIAYRLSPDDVGAVKLKAGKLFIQEIERNIEKQESIIVEATLAGKGYQRQIEAARKCGFAVSIIYLFLDSPELSVERVKERVPREFVFFTN